jgi:peptidyl-dipeptidase Dcp
MRSTSGEHDTRGLIIETAKLREERAKLLRFETHAHYVLEERMARDPETVSAFLDRLGRASKPAALRELQTLQTFAGMELKPWDVAYYSEKLRMERYDFDEEKLRPYFELDACVKGAFEIARKLYGLVLTERPDLPVYHPDVKAFEVKRESDGGYVGLFYADFFPRDSKSGGAWCSAFRGQWKDGAKDVRPHVTIVCNFTKPTTNEPSLLGIEEVRTLFHEFGHALHALLSRCQYRSLSGTNVYWDFVELPSQVMENWTKEADALHLFARHYRTGELLPMEMVGKLKEASRFQAGMASLISTSRFVVEV